MKRTKLLAMLVCIAMVLAFVAGCQGTDAPAKTDTPANPNTPANPDATPSVTPQANVSDETELTYLFSDDVTDWNYLVATSNTPAMYIDSLVEYDYLGLCQPCLAESWTRSEDGLVWTFKIREGVKWMTYDKQEYAEVTAQDWVTSAQYILDAANASRLADMMFTIAGAEEYYSKSVAGEECDFSTVGVKALDDYTLEYTLKAPVPYFLSSLTYKNFFPANAQFIAECGDMFSTDHETMLYCGEFIMSNYVPQQIIESELNPTYWDMANMHITKITEIYNAEASTVEPEMYLRGEVNSCDVPTEQLDEWLNDPEKYDMIRPCRPSFYAYYYMFNFYPNFDEKYEPENWKLAVNNVNFRKSILHAFDKVAMVEVDDPYNAEAHVQNTVTPADFISAAGVDYTQLDAISEFANGTTYNTDLANEYKAKAIEELTAAGAKFPIIIYTPYNTGSTYDTQRVQVFEQMKKMNNMSDEELFRFIEFDSSRAESTAYSGYSYWKSTFKVFMSKRSTRLILYFLIAILLFTFVQPYLPGQKSPTEIFINPETGRQYRSLQPNSEFWFGTNTIGQDLWSRIWSGTRTTMLIAVIAVASSTIIGIIIGAIWGYVRVLDRLFTEIYNVINNVPTTVLRMLITYIMKPSVGTLIFAMCLTNWVGMAKWIRNLIIIIRDREYNLASRCLGTPTRRVIVKNLLPQIVSVVMLDIALSIPGVIGSEVFLTYIGLGLPVETPSLGNLIDEGRRVMMNLSQTYQLVFPAIVVAAITVSFYALGNKFADASDPRNHV